MITDSPIEVLSGVGQQRSALLGKLGIKTIGDLVYFFPRYIEDRGKTVKIRDMRAGDAVCVQAQVYVPVQEHFVRNNMRIYTMLISDETGVASVMWFNNKYVKNVFRKGDIYRFYGKVTVKNGRREIVSPVYENVNSSLHTGRVVPVYPLTENLHQKTIRNVMMEAVSKVSGNLNEYLPQNIRHKFNLCEINYAIANIHFPQTEEDYEIARKRFVFEELLLFQLGILKMRTQSTTGGIKLDTSDCGGFTGLLPFSLTNAQKRVVSEIYADLSSGKAMNRLVQGDVGSGKTVVAFASIYAAMKNGFQSALMAPTEVLASQHYKSACTFFGEENVVLLTGSVTGKKRAAVLEKIKSGQASVVIGTHAVIEDNVEFKNLALAITDEQHRFGVRQRALLSKKGETPHVLIMSATPIPRTLALILYGDLDISVVDELPPGRQNVDTFVVDLSMRQRIDKFIEKNVMAGRQVYVVCPLVEDSQTLDLKAATAVKQRLEEIFPQFSVALLHGKMKPKEKNEIMEKFASGQTNILVSTTVIEVGVNVPNATVMIIENAERFGLSQLHQIRGRVGRGDEKSYCILFYGGEDKNIPERLGVIKQTNDGFVISQKDMELRGPGDILGLRQHGLPDMKLADLFSDMKTFRLAQDAALEIMRSDPGLEKGEHLFLKEKLNRMFSDVLNGNIVG